MAPGHEPDIFAMRKKVDDLARQLTSEKRALAEREKAIKDGDARKIARELHAALCLSVTCEGWEDSGVRMFWTAFAESLLSSYPSLERTMLVDLAVLFAGNPFYQSIRAAQLQLAGGPADLPDDTLATDLAPDLVLAAPVSEPDAGPTPASQEPTQEPMSGTVGATKLLDLTDDDIPF